MKILEFRRTETLEKIEYAEILVEYLWFFKRVIPIYKNIYGSYWRREDSSFLITGQIIDKLAARWDKENS